MASNGYSHMITFDDSDKYNHIVSEKSSKKLIKKLKHVLTNMESHHTKLNTLSSYISNIGIHGLNPIRILNSVAYDYYYVRNKDFIKFISDVNNEIKWVQIIINPEIVYVSRIKIDHDTVTLY